MMQHIVEDGLNKGQINSLATIDRSHWSTSKDLLCWDDIPI